VPARVARMAGQSRASRELKYRTIVSEIAVRSGRYCRCGA
jgi:hypothetical protein